jgi:hypothetical protein
VYKRTFYLNKIAPYIDKPVIKVITGMRRVGKSYFLRQLIDQLLEGGVRRGSILFIDKESLEFEWVETYRDLHDEADRFFRNVPGKKYLLVDEVQEITDWEKGIVSLAGKGDVDIFITGSNAHLLSSELATLLSGRCIEFPLYSLSFDEFILFHGEDASNDEETFMKYLRFGGLPAIHHFGLEEEIVYHYISSIYNTILLKDIVKRNNIRNVSLLERITRYVFDNIGNIFSAKSIADYLKSQRLRVGIDTVQSYVGYLTDALLLHKVQRYDIKGKRQLEIYEKYYLSDIGVRHALLGYREADIAGILENVVFIELKRRGYQVYVGKLGDKEIDFIATREKEKLYVQVAYLLSSPETAEREFGPLLAIPDNYPKFVVSMDRVYGSDEHGIQRIYLPDFL